MKASVRSQASSDSAAKSSWVVTYPGAPHSFFDRRLRQGRERGEAGTVGGFQEQVLVGHGRAGDRRHGRVGVELEAHAGDRIAAR